VALHQVSEVIPVPNAVSVPLTQPWFRGVANVRGNLYSIVDFQAFQGREVVGSGMERRVILISERLLGGAGFMVSRMLGLRNPDQFTKLERPADAGSLGGRRVRGRGRYEVAGAGPARAGTPARIP